jgi:hypothetical protein
MAGGAAGLAILGGLENTNTPTEMNRKSGEDDGFPVFGRMEPSSFRSLRGFCTFATFYEPNVAGRQNLFVTHERQSLYRLRDAIP